ncbi:MAG: iron ABC transporter permease, partial [Treponema sp.]|nr:iron ABC transporter permease [Treponema sp.]
MKSIPYTLFISMLTLLLIMAIYWSLFSGSVSVSFKTAIEAFLFLIDRGGDETAAALVFQIRLPRIILAVLVGASLGTAGAAFQGLFRNSLADPYIIGASSGAALGAALALSIGGSTALGFFSVLGLPGFCAFAGSFVAVILAFAISRASGSNSPGTLILAGISVGAFCSAMLALVIVLKDRSLVQVYYWLLGSLSGTTWTRLISALPFMVLGNLVIFLSVRPLDLLL